MSNFLLGDDQVVKIGIMGIDDRGNHVPATLDAPATWSSSDDTVVTVHTDTDGVTGVALATGTLGTNIVLHVTGTGAGGTALLDATFDLDVVPTAEVAFALVAGTPSKQQAPAPPTA